MGLDYARGRWGDYGSGTGADRGRIARARAVMRDHAREGDGKIFVECFSPSSARASARGCARGVDAREAWIARANPRIGALVVRKRRETARTNAVAMDVIG